ncbi:unnamed protein product [Porites lobata]|uniref:Uncharacterized protein n=1 Tax=Porites lobata TaxID=104759 RepID=A0ABN8NR53_9CNID|nr:unnamed protein product [Porites lobata]
MDVVKPCNLTRKRQAVLESRTDHRTNKRRCLENSSWRAENMLNQETENRSLHSRQSLAEHSQYPSPPTLNVHIDINCNVVHEHANQVNEVQGMELAYDSANVHPYHPPSSTVSERALLMANRSSLPTCPRCLTGEPGHISHLQLSS